MSSIKFSFLLYSAQFRVHLSVREAVV